MLKAPPESWRLRRAGLCRRTKAPRPKQGLIGIFAPVRVLRTALLALAALALPAAYAQDVGGGVDVDGSWWMGSGLEAGDYFSYDLCHVNYKECREFRMDIWIEGERAVDTEQKWLAKTVVYDGPRTIKGEMELGQISAEPSGGTDNLAQYRDAFKSSVAWLAAFTGSPEDYLNGPKAFRDFSWNNTTCHFCQRPRPTAAEEVSVPAGEFESVVVGWRASGKDSQIWVVPDLPFPVKASTWMPWAEGDAPQEYAFELLGLRRGVTSDPFASVVPTAAAGERLGCPDLDTVPFLSPKTTTKNFSYGMEVLYRPENPKEGCELDWLIKFKTDGTEFLNHVRYDLLVVDQDLKPLRSLAQEEGQTYLYSPSGLAEPSMPVKEGPGTHNYAVWVYGLAPKPQMPDFAEMPADYLVVPLEVLPSGLAPEPGSAPPAGGAPELPSWIKTNARLWSDGTIDDSTFISAIQYLAGQGVIRIPLTAQSGQGGDIPPFVRDNAGYWADGIIDDATFVAGLQHLVRIGSIVV